jgi:hypothetical protein
VKAHDTDLPWLPNIADTPLREAYDTLCDSTKIPTADSARSAASASGG